MQLSGRLLEKGLVGHWKFDEPVATHNSQMLDSSGYGNHGILSTGDGSTNKSVAGKLGKGLSFDGVNDYVNRTVSDFQISDSQGTFSAWIKTSTGSFSKAVASSADTLTTSKAWLVWIYIGGYVAMQTRSATENQVTGSTIITDNKWHYITITSSGTAWAIYVDGKVETLFTVFGSNNGDWFADVANRDNFNIGAMYWNEGAHYNFNGSIDDVRIYNRVLSAGEVSMLFLDRGIISNRSRNSFIVQLIEKQYIQSSLLLENVQTGYILSSLTLENQITNNILSSLNIENFTTAYTQSGLTLEQFTKQYILSSLSLGHTALAYLLSGLDLEAWAKINITSSLNMENYVKEFIQCSLDLVGEIMRLNITITKRKDNITIT